MNKLKITILSIMAGVTVTTSHGQELLSTPEIIEKEYPITFFLEQYPDEINNLINAELELCSSLLEEGFRKHYEKEEIKKIKQTPLWVTDKFIQLADVTGDGVPDYIIDYVGTVCLPAYSYQGRYKSYKVFEGSDNEKQKLTLLIDGSRMDGERHYVELMDNGQGYYDLLAPASGSDCGQKEYLEITAAVWSCEKQLHWGRERREFSTTLRMINNH